MIEFCIVSTCVSRRWLVFFQFKNSRTNQISVLVVKSTNVYSLPWQARFEEFVWKTSFEIIVKLLNLFDMINIDLVVEFLRNPRFFSIDEYKCNQIRFKNQALPLRASCARFLPTGVFIWNFVYACELLVLVSQVRTNRCCPTLWLRKQHQNYRQIFDGGWKRLNRGFARKQLLNTNLKKVFTVRSVL